ncbi:hypothetical protein BH23PLA1_BH23PLA1_12720 [soil metagenome]
MESSHEAAIIGGGFFGCMIALRLRESLRHVVVLEAGNRLLGRASYANQARVHNGYHYPRSFLTAFRSRVNFPRFVGDFEDCIDSGFEKYYAVARRFSKVSAAQFRHFMERVGAPIEPAPERVGQLFDPEHIEQVFKVREYAFNADKLSDRLRKALDTAGVEVRFGCEVDALAGGPGGSIRLLGTGPEGPWRLRAGQVFNCTYSRINKILSISGLPTIPLKHELTEMALVDVPATLKGLGITVMCGPFFSAMPFPALGRHTLSHVRFTPHASWCDDGNEYRDPYEVMDRWPRRSRFVPMLRDSSRYLPALAGSGYAGSLWEVKTVLPASEVSDSRPILMRAHHGLPNLHCVLGAKIDNIYDALDAIGQISQVRKAG